MKRTKEILRASAGVLAIMLAATLAQAAEAAGGAGDQAAPGTSFKWVHFVILAGLAYWLFKKVLPPTFRHRADSIGAAIAKAKAARIEAERLLKEAEAKLGTLEEEVAHFRAQAQADAAAELERLRAATKVEAEKIGIAAKAEIEAAERAARVELKKLAAQLAMDRAESLVAKELTPALQEAMLSDFVQSLQGRPN